MAITHFRVEGYRSIKDLWLKLQPINVIIGPNGCGKSNLYRALYLIWCAANGEFAKAIATEGGIQSALWAGDFSKHDKRQIALSVRFDDYQYKLRFGKVDRLAVSEGSMFRNDPEIKYEEIFLCRKGQRTSYLKRGRAEVKAVDAGKQKVDYTMRVADNESILTGLRDPDRFPELFKVRREFLNWRFYHHFRTDFDSPLRAPQTLVSTPVMHHDGTNFVPALATIMEGGDENALWESIEEAFPGAKLHIQPGRNVLKLSMSFPGVPRPLSCAELSDGTIQYLCLLAAMLSMRAPSVLVLNEPETSLHSSLLEPLAKLIVRASRDCQIWITTHSQELSDYILDYSGYPPIELEKVAGETRLHGRALGGDLYEDVDELDKDDST